MYEFILFWPLVPWLETMLENIVRNPVSNLSRIECGHVPNMGVPLTTPLAIFNDLSV